MSEEKSRVLEDADMLIRSLRALEKTYSIYQLEERFKTVRFQVLIKEIVKEYEDEA